MKNNNLITLSILCIACLLVFAFSTIVNHLNTTETSERNGWDNAADIAQSTTDAFLTNANPNNSSNVITENTTTISTKKPSKKQDIKKDKKPNNASSEKNTENMEINPVSMKNTLFIGDSRTVGIMEYSGLEDASFFCDTGMSVFNVQKEKLSIPSIGKVTLDELLSSRKYDKIYVMLGINELGYSFQSVIDKYCELHDYVKAKQNTSIIIVQANLHVSKKRSDNDKYINNSNLNKLNNELAKISRQKNILYIDPNPLFDDENGNLASDKTSDDAHLYAKYYKRWGNWICTETAKVIKEAGLD